MSQKPTVVIVSRRWFMAIVVALILGTVALMTAIIHPSYVDTKSNKYWCELVEGLDKRYKNLPPDADEEAKELAATIARLRSNLAC